MKQTESPSLVASAELAHAEGRPTRTLARRGVGVCSHETKQSIKPIVALQALSVGE